MVDGEAEFFVGLGEVEVVGEGVFEGGSVITNGLSDGAEVLGASFVVGFEFSDDEPLVFAVVVKGFDAGGKSFRSGCFGVVEKEFAGGVDKGRVKDMFFGFGGEVLFPVLAGVFVDVEGAFEVGFFDVLVPVAEAPGGDAGDGCEGGVGGVGEAAVVAGGLEGAVPESMGVGVGEGGA